MRQIILLLILSSISLPGWTAFKIEGEFVATSRCPAYLSKNKQTNPGQFFTDSGRSYTIVGANREDQPDWLQLRIDGATQPRWVERRCGKLAAQSTPQPRPNCNTTGYADSYVLALSWQPAFCESHRRNAECRDRATDQYHAHRFTLHGLWPNRNDCPKQKGYYDYCGRYTEANKPRNFCDYPQLELDRDTRQRLGNVMPSAGAGSCLQRHEWFKHGSCQNQWTTDEYFDAALALTKQFHSTAIGQWLDRNLGKQVRTEDFFHVVDQSFGPDAHRRLQLSCSKGQLRDVYLELPATLNTKMTLAELIQQASDEKHSNNCGPQFELDELND